jgi:hypothetical protein
LVSGVPPEADQVSGLRLRIADFGFWIESHHNLGIANLGIKEMKIQEFKSDQILSVNS